MARFRAAYGAGPLHLLGVLICLAVVGYALPTALSLTGRPERWLVWFGGGIVAHDFVLLPLYSLLGLLAVAALAPGARRTRAGIAALNHLRLPALLSGLLLLVWYPLILGPGARTFTRASGLSKDVYLERWLILTASLFALSALVLLIRLPGLRRVHDGQPAGGRSS
jgi:hypothetical protein